MTKPQLTKQIKTEVLQLADKERSTTLLVRCAIGRSIIALQVLSDDRSVGNGRATYEPARLLVVGWLAEVNSSITDAILQQCTYMALRLHETQIEILSEKGMTFCQVYSMLTSYKDSAASVRSFISKVKAGKETDFSRFIRQHQASCRKLTKIMIQEEGGLIHINVVLTGGECEEEYIGILESIFSVGRRLTLPLDELVAKALERVKRMTG